MIPKQQNLIRATWALVAPNADQAAAVFYRRLFELDPQLARLFEHVDMHRQGRMLMQTLAVVVKSVEDLVAIVPAIEALGRRHASYGVRTQDYATVGEALLWTLQAGLGDAFTPAARQAWATAYEVLSSVMISATESEAELGAAANLAPSSRASAARPTVSPDRRAPAHLVRVGP